MLSKLTGIGLGAVGTIAALLPARHWERFPRVPIARMVVLSAVLTSTIGAWAGALGFLSYGAHAADLANRAVLDTAERQVRGELNGHPDITTATSVTIGGFSLVAFALFTPLGLISLYLVASGVVRVASSIAGEAMGDPLLTGFDTLISLSWRSRRARRMARERARREGRALPDRLFPGAWAGLPEADYVVVSSRRKPDWTKGTTVVTPERWYTLGEPFDLELPIGLRTIYPLTAQTAVEVLRRSVLYDLPPLEAGPRRPA